MQIYLVLVANVSNLDFYAYSRPKLLFMDVIQTTFLELSLSWNILCLWRSQVRGCLPCLLPVYKRGRYFHSLYPECYSFCLPNVFKVSLFLSVNFTTTRGQKSHLLDHTIDGNGLPIYELTPLWFPKLWKRRYFKKKKWQWHALKRKKTSPMSFHCCWFIKLQVLSLQDSVCSVSACLPTSSPPSHLFSFCASSCGSLSTFFSIWEPSEMWLPN